MTSNAINWSETKTKTPCGRCACIILYKGQYCLFCDAARELLGETVSQFGVTDNVICQVDIDTAPFDSCGCSDDVTQLPTIRICNVVLEGLPDEGQVNDAVIRALMMDCFCENPAE
ncbi:MAG: hypothetical protein ACFE7R_02875 [Candidatus Hodarchaeota archaeon]